MPYIILQGCNTDRMMQQVDIKATVKFRGDVYRENRNKCDLMLKELEADLNNVLTKYFHEYNDTESEVLTNHEYNLKMNYQ